MSQQNVERRTAAAKIELRSVGGKSVLSGYAAVFGQYSLDLGGFREKLQRGCFSGPLAERQDTKALFNHDMSAIVGRVKNSTLTLRQDEHGLWFDCVLPDTTIGRDLQQNVASGLIDACSFGFTVENGADEWGKDSDENGSFVCRTVKRVRDLIDISAVSAAAYPQTSCSVSERALRQARALLTGAVPTQEQLIDRYLRMRAKEIGEEIRRDSL